MVSRRADPPRWRTPPSLALLGLAALLAVLLATGWLGIGPLAAGPARPSASSGATSSPALVLASPSASHGGEPSPGEVAVPIVPVTQFRAPWDATTLTEVAAVLSGSSKRYSALELTNADADLVLSALGLARPDDPSRLVLAASAVELRTDLRAHRDRLAFLRLGEVDPSVRALAWGDVSLFGVRRLSTLAGWPLSIDVPAADANGFSSGATAAYDPSIAWTLVAGGDIMLDRGVADELEHVGKGADFPFDGGSAQITARTCCSFFGFQVAQASRTGDAGAVRQLFSLANVAVANFENPAPDNFRYHDSGTTFSADPALIRGLADAGFDWVSIANNHIRDFGARGVLDTIRNLNHWGIAHSGAGANLTAARAPSILRAGGIRIALLGYDTIAPAYAAGPDRVGTNEMTVARVTADVAAARRLGADLVIVYPHWGVEYTTSVTLLQRQLAHAAIDAGADLVIGNHPHWAGAVEIYKGKEIFYALGNLVFDQTWSERTMEGITLEMTFEGTRLVQVDIRPHVILDRAQPNFMDPAGSGQVVMDQVFGASTRTLPW